RRIVVAALQNARIIVATRATVPGTRVGLTFRGLRSDRHIAPTELRGGRVVLARVGGTGQLTGRRGVLATALDRGRIVVAADLLRGRLVLVAELQGTGGCGLV